VTRLGTILVAGLPALPLILFSSAFDRAAAVTKAERNIRYNVCRDTCRPDNHSCKRACNGRFQNCLFKAN
jgi:hypothetical protein